MDAKYISINVDDHDLMFTFPKCIDHDKMHDAIMVTPVNIDSHCFEGHLLSAGFITAHGNCHGRSETLSIASLPKDTELFSNNQIIEALFVKEPELPALPPLRHYGGAGKLKVKAKSYSKSLASRFKKTK